MLQRPQDEEAVIEGHKCAMAFQVGTATPVAAGGGATPIMTSGLATPTGAPGTSTPRVGTKVILEGVVVAGLPAEAVAGAAVAAGEAAADNREHREDAVAVESGPARINVLTKVLCWFLVCCPEHFGRAVNKTIGACQF